MEQKSVLGLEPKKDVMSAIKKSAKKSVVLHIKYVDSNGTLSDRDIEPYEIRNNKLWAFSLDKGSIRQFNLERIIEARVSTMPFVPRFPQKII